MSTKQIVRKQLDQRFSELCGLRNIQRPVSGWLRAIRDALNMSSLQMAKRLGVSKQRVSALEKAEVNGSTTINSMCKAAEALDCIFVYAVLPRDSLESTVKEQARKIAVSQQAYATHTMALEDQAPMENERNEALEEAISKLVRTSPKALWD